MQNNNWKELDYRVASDYTHGSPEYYRTLLRQMIGLPKFLPGEKGDISQQQHIKRDSVAGTPKRHMSSDVQQGKG